ncbi:MAG TPA: hypothetical protein VMW67_08240 [Desulfobacteria bacterium]|nr:hypothetical protein [Desulfobacteria bacterium]
MRLPDLKDELRSQLEEFDIWITPTLGEIADTDKFRHELDLVVSTFEVLGKATDNFSSIDVCQPDAIADVMADVLAERSTEEREELLQALASALFAVTGKSDNNFKCQFPLFLRDAAQWEVLPFPKMRKGRRIAEMKPIPRVLTSNRYMSIISRIDRADLEARLLKQFISFLLKDDNAINQFWSLGYAYFALKEFEKERDLLAPLVIFKVRGSVMVSRGHEPEHILREQMLEWGMREGVDFNTTDVVVLEDEQVPDQKTRAYDFILPFKTPGWPDEWSNRIFIQCQFYAGDSGSVSHKNVDQTKSSRLYISGFTENTRFVEYVDGAGYFSSLNGDLRMLLAYEDTHGIIQIRTAPIRLRYYLQQIGYLTPLEIEHAVAIGKNSEKQLYSHLELEGYEIKEINRCLDDCIDREIIMSGDNGLEISSMRRDIARRYFLLDLACRQAEPYKRGGLAGKVLVPGYGAFSGTTLDHLASTAIKESPLFSKEFEKSTTFLEDIRWLSERGFMMAR